uniref:Delta-like protein n=1 Tax=Ditylenchus dipsaci TaxID=166011 RepID=A0A915CPP5_9BILA
MTNCCFIPTLSTTSSQNSLIYQLSASCHAGYVGEGCALVCEPPNPSDHYHCDSQKGMVCDPGWSGPRCGLPICSLPCLNSASCAGPDECRCSKGWRGKQCEECIPKQGCRNGYCLSEPGKCICKPNWTGADCELRIDKCWTSRARMAASAPPMDYTEKLFIAVVERVLLARIVPSCQKRPEEESDPQVVQPKQNFKGYEIDLAKDEEEVTSIRSSLIKNKPIIMEEAGDMVKEGVGRSGRVLLDISQTSSFCSRNRRRSAISLVHFSEQDEEEALELELRQNISGEEVDSLSTLLLLKSPPPPYSECSTQQDDSFSAEGAGSYAGVQPSTSTNLQSIDELDAEADQIDPKARSSTAIRSKDSPSTAVIQQISGTQTTISMTVDLQPSDHKTVGPQLSNKVVLPQKSIQNIIGLQSHNQKKVGPQLCSLLE